MLHHPWLGGWSVYLIVAGIAWGSTSIGTILLAGLVAAGQFWQRRKIAEIHVIVNSQRTQMLERIARLEGSLGIKPGAPAPDAVDVTVAAQGGKE